MENLPKKRGRPPGRPPKYTKEEIFDHSYKLTLMKHTEKEIANFFEVSERAFEKWKKKWPELVQAIARGKDIADEEVVIALRDRAIGYSHPEDKIFLGKNGKPVVVPTIKHYPPETDAIKLYLGNRHPDKWRDKVGVELTGKEGDPLMMTNLEAANRLVFLVNIALARKKEQEQKKIADTSSKNS
jgi:hypothetical protein